MDILTLSNEALNVSTNCMLLYSIIHQRRPLFSVQERLEMISEECKDLDNVEVVGRLGLLVDFARKME